MSAAFDRIKAGLTEALAHAKGQPSAVREHRVNRVDVRELRAQIGLTQEQFSAKFGISLPTLRHWERVGVAERDRKRTESGASGAGIGAAVRRRLQQ